MPSTTRTTIPDFDDEEVISERTVDARAALAVPLAHPRSSHLKPRSPRTAQRSPPRRLRPPRRQPPATSNGGNGTSHEQWRQRRCRSAGMTAQTPPATSVAERIRLARQKGYEGDPCSKCGQLTLVRSGACMRCDSCGETSGCG